MSPQLVALFEQYRAKQDEHKRLARELWDLRETIDAGLAEEGYMLKVLPVPPKMPADVARKLEQRARA